MACELYDSLNLSFTLLIVLTGEVRPLLGLNSPGFGSNLLELKQRAFSKWIKKAASLSMDRGPDTRAANLLDSNQLSLQFIDTGRAGINAVVHSGFCLCGYFLYLLIVTFKHL